MHRPTFTYVRGSDAPSLTLWVRENGALLDLATGYTYSLTVVTEPGATPAFTKTTGITGATGAGVPPSGTPNVTIQWATSGELNDLTAGTTYLAQLAITTSADGRSRLRQFYLDIVAAA